jgi:hypothetical protein
MRSARLVLVVFGCLQSVSAFAQESVTVAAEFLFYGDNTEFSNAFREGETLFGNSGRLVLAADIGGRATLTGGVLGDRRYGSDDAFRIVRPIFSLDLEAGASHFTFGTLTLPHADLGPDRGSPHGLLPPIQRETLSLTRPYEAGLQWTYDTARVKHEFWLDWQRLNTPAARETFDVGTVGRVGLKGPVAFGYQAHIVHHGGQLHSNGPVSDSWVVAPGLLLERSAASAWRSALETYVLASRHVPDREQLDRSTTGAAVFRRAAIEHDKWRGHLVVWRGNDFIKEEGDANYGGLRRDGSRFRKVRDYAEAGLTRAGSPVAGVLLEGSARLHRIENEYEYSFRIVGRVALRWRLR